MYELPSNKEETIEEDSWVDEHLFLIATTDPWYGTLITYLQTQRIDAQFSSIERCRIRYQARRYLIIMDNLYSKGIDLVLIHYLVHEEAEQVLNDFHIGVCGGHHFGWLEIAQKYCVQDTFGPKYSKIASMMLKSVILAIFIQ